MHCAPRKNATRILHETERLLRTYGHRKITVADVADACLYLASPLAAYVSGALLAVHGGGEWPLFLHLAKVPPA